MLIFKYLSPDAVYRVFEREGEIALKFGLPQSFNDPYELFLRTDQPLDSDEAMAFYEHFLRDIPQLPVTCFSKHPQSIVMWAHYAREGKGVCLGFDEDVLVESFPIAYIDDVSYSEEPAQIKSSLVNYAFVTGKRRHTMRMIEIALRAIYFMKRIDWQYENERRLIVDETAVQLSNQHYVARVSVATLRYIILGQNIDNSLRRFCEASALATRVQVLQFCVGKRGYEPLFLQQDEYFHWNGTNFDAISNICPQCGDAIDVLPVKGICRWCGISEESRWAAVAHNMFSATLHYGIDKGIPIHFDGLPPRGYLVKRATESLNSLSKETKPEGWSF